MNPKALKRLRKKLKLSLRDVAAQVHVTPRTWARYEAGEHDIPETVLHLFCMLNKVKYPPK